MKKKKKKPAGLKRSRPSATEASLNNEIVWNYLPSFNHHQNSTETSNWANKYYFGTSHSDHSTSEHTCSSFLFKKTNLHPLSFWNELRFDMCDLKKQANWLLPQRMKNRQWDTDAGWEWQQRKCQLFFSAGLNELESCSQYWVVEKLNGACHHQRTLWLQHWELACGWTWVQIPFGSSVSSKALVPVCCLVTVLCG